MLQRFESKKDLWLSVVLWVAVFAMAVAGWNALTMPLAGWQQVVVVSVNIAAAVLILWIWFGTYYEVGKGSLVIRCGPFRWAVDLDAISAVERTRAAWSSPALSLDRLRIEYGDNKWVMVSPDRLEAFVDALSLPELTVRSRRRGGSPRK